MKGLFRSPQAPSIYSHWHEKLQRRCGFRFHEIASHNNRNNIPRLWKKEYDWFCTKLQNNTIRLQLGSARYAPRFTPSIDIDPPTIFWRFATHGAWHTFSRDGLVNISGIFSYLPENAQYSQWINLELAMYEHHSHSKGKSGKRLGWLRDMCQWYSYSADRSTRSSLLRPRCVPS